MRRFVDERTSISLSISTGCDYRRPCECTFLFQTGGCEPAVNARSSSSCSASYSRVCPTIGQFHCSRLPIPYRWNLFFPPILPPSHFLGFIPAPLVLGSQICVFTKIEVPIYTNNVSCSCLPKTCVFWSPGVLLQETER